MFSEKDLEMIERGSARIDAARERVKRVMGMIIGLATSKRKGWVDNAPWGEKLAFSANAGDQELSNFRLDLNGKWHLELWYALGEDGIYGCWRHIKSDYHILADGLLALEAALPAIVSLIVDNWQRVEAPINFLAQVGRGAEE